MVIVVSEQDAAGMTERLVNAADAAKSDSRVFKIGSIVGTEDGGLPSVALSGSF